MTGEFPFLGGGGDARSKDVLLPSKYVFNSCVICLMPMFLSKYNLFKMKLVKISEHNAAIEIYRVHQPSKAYKKLFPKRFTFALQFGNKVQSGNENMLPLCATFDGCVGYVFTTQNLTLPSMRDDEDFGNTFPVNLNQYFITDSENYDLIFEITPTHSSSPKYN